MPEVGVSIEGADDFARALDALQQRMHAATRDATRDGLTLLEQHARTELSRYAHARGTPTPSPPGEPPARISGHLRGSLSPTGPYPGGGGFTGELGPTAVYARIQELGGQAGRGHSVTLPPRPYMAPAVRAARNRLRTLYVEAWHRAL